MDFLKKQLDVIQQNLSGLNATQKMLTGALVVIMVLTMVMWGRYAGSAEMEPVLNQTLAEDDMARMSRFRSDPDLTALLVQRSYETARWMLDHGVRFYPAVGRQAFNVGGRFRFWGGLALHINGGGQQLVETLHRAAARYSAAEEPCRKNPCVVDDEQVAELASPTPAKELRQVEKTRVLASLWRADHQPDFVAG